MKREEIYKKINIAYCIDYENGIICNYFMEDGELEHCDFFNDNCRLFYCENPSKFDGKDFLERIRHSDNNIKSFTEEELLNFTEFDKLCPVVG